MLEDVAVVVEEDEEEEVTVVDLIVEDVEAVETPWTGLLACGETPAGEGFLGAIVVTTGRIPLFSRLGTGSRRVEEARGERGRRLID